MGRALTQLLLASALLLLATATHAGPPRVRPVKGTPIPAQVQKFSQRQISRLLADRVERTYQRALRLQANLPNPVLSTLSAPVRRAGRVKGMYVEPIYPDKPFLTTRLQTTHYMLAQSNRLVVPEMQRLQTLQDQLRRALPQLQQAAQQTVQPDDPIDWLAQHIPAQTTLIHIGELHNIKETYQAVMHFLDALRQQNPAKPIVLLTEFLPENFRWTYTTPDKLLDLPEYAPIWRRAAQNNIPVIGLDPSFTFYDRCNVAFHLSDDITHVSSQWTHLEGVRLRNERWAKVIQSYRAENPDALFVVYDGAAHSLYNHPFALPAQLPGEQSFVVALFPHEIVEADPQSRFASLVENVRLVRFKEPLEFILPQAQFTQPLVYLPDPHLARLAGFDVRIRLPIKLENYPVLR